jgi:hypothetical protein
LLAPVLAMLSSFLTLHWHQTNQLAFPSPFVGYSFLSTWHSL